jgi:tetratricopeptide (TPR) repeat protein
MTGADIDAALDAAIQFHQQVRLQDAETLYQAVLAARPRDFNALHLSGVLALQTGRAAMAEARIGAALSVDPTVAIAHGNLGNALRRLGRFDEALARYDAALALAPQDASIRVNRGAVLRDLGRLDEAVESYDAAIALNPNDAEAFSNRGVALRDLAKPEAALESFDRALALQPKFAEAWSNRGNALHDLARFSEAIADHERAIAIKPDYADAYWNRGQTLLLLGDFETGWMDYERRKLKDPPVANRIYPQPFWFGAQDYQGKTVLIHAEQGLGDTIQFCRYVLPLEAMGVKVLFAPQRPIRALMKSLSPTVEIVDADDAALRFDYHWPLMSLPLTFGTRLATIPASAPYLSAEPDRVARWRERIGADGFRIGVSWRGSSGRISLERAFPPSAFAAIAALPGVRLFSLQKGEGEADLAAHSGLAIEQLVGLDEGPDAFLDTAAVMQALDLVITCDTAIAHLAGALGRPTWVPLKHVPDWRWLLGRGDSPWYPTLRLFRQETRGDWAPVFAAMEAALRAHLASEAHPTSWPSFPSS